MSYETKPIAVKAFRVEFEIEIKHYNGMYGFLVAKEGDWIVKDEMGEIFIFNDEDFRARYRPQSPPLNRGTIAHDGIF